MTNSTQLSETPRVLVVAGTFNDNGGRASKIGHDILLGIEDRIYDAYMSAGRCDFFNGGFFGELEKKLENLEDYEEVFWFANIPNDRPKLLPRIKEIAPKCILVSSKRNTGGEYSVHEVLAHALKNKSNLVLEIDNGEEDYRGRLLDPLGNLFGEGENFYELGYDAQKRADKLRKYTRVPSQSSGDALTSKGNEEFFKLIRDYADRFHELIHSNSKNVERFMGNASFRCENRERGLIFVSRRNIDKRSINASSFVAVEPESPVRCVKYFGEVKPSVDTPIQIALYNHFKNINFMLHGHVYIRDAPFTGDVVPCGAIEEADEIIKKITNRGCKYFAINLRGHGSLVGSDEPRKFKELDYIPRNIPERQEAGR